METADSLVHFEHGLVITENENWKCFVGTVCLSMLDRIKDICVLMPNKSITALVEWVESVICNVNERVSLLSFLNLPSHFDDDYKSNFLTEYLCYTEQLLVFMRNKLLFEKKR